MKGFYLDESPCLPNRINEYLKIANYLSEYRNDREKQLKVIQNLGIDTYIQTIEKDLFSVEKDPWNKSKSYKEFTLVQDRRTHTIYLSRKYVPKNIEIDNREYWFPFSSTSLPNITDPEEAREMWINNN